MKEVSVVIPTRNRQDNLLQLLNDLSMQVYRLTEVIIVDSSDEPLQEGWLKGQYPSLHIVYIRSEASVCIQRNIGIRRAKTPYVFLCDDDITLTPDYVALLMKYADEGKGAISGLIMQKDENSQWVYQYPPQSFRHLLFAFIFQQSVWGEIEPIKVSGWARPLYAWIKAFYRGKGNTLSLAGWPIITQLPRGSFDTTIYGLGASIIRKDWLIQSPFEEVLDPHGIGDNYGVAVGLPQPVCVVTDAKAYHHQSQVNRLDQSRTYFRRILALHYFLRRSGQFTRWNRLWFLWSLTGNMILHSNKGYRKASRIAICLILKGANPYRIASQANIKCATPNF